MPRRLMKVGPQSPAAMPDREMQISQISRGTSPFPDLEVI